MSYTKTEIAGKAKPIAERYDIPWNSIKGIRDHFAKGYGEMDAEIIYNTVVHDIPKPKNMLEQLIK